VKSKHPEDEQRMNVLKSNSLARSALRGRDLFRRGALALPPSAPSVSNSLIAAARAGAASTASAGSQERSFQTAHYGDHASFAVPDVVVDELDPRNFGYRVVDPFEPRTPSASLYEEDYDVYSLHVSPTQATCTSYYVDVLGDELPDLPASNDNVCTKSSSFQSHVEPAAGKHSSDT
jgi:hypothetical protein